MLAVVVFVEGPNRHDRHDREKQRHNEANDEEEIAVGACEGEIKERYHHSQDQKDTGKDEVIHVVMIAFGNAGF